MNRFFLLIVFLLIFVTGLIADQCIECHSQLQPNIVSDLEISKHRQNDVTCSTCHGDAHTTKDDYAKVQIPTPETCNECHDTQVAQFKKGKHALAWTVLNAMPTIHHQPGLLIEGMKGCGGCHKIGLKSEEDVKKLKKEG